MGPTTTSNGEEVDVLCGVVHPGYLSPFVTVLGDVAILKLATNVTTVTEFVQLNRDPNYPETAGTDMTVIGFGKTSNNGGTSNTLRKVGTFFVPYDTCVETYTSAVVRPEAHLCGDVPGKGDCNGDSGGPVMDNDNTQVGVVSFGYGGCASDYQDVYAKVATYIDWIDEQMDDDFCPERPATNGGSICGFAKSIAYLANVHLVERVTSCFGRIFSF